MKNILVYLGDYTDKQEALETVLSDMKLTYSILTDDDLHEFVGYLFGIDVFPKTSNAQEAVHFVNDLLILNDVQDERIQEMNDRLKKQNVTMKRKAMLTKHNAGWYLKDLMKEIEEEHHYFILLEEIQNLLQASSELVIDSYTPASWNIYEQAFYQGYACLQKQNTVEELEAILQALQQAKQNLVKIS